MLVKRGGLHSVAKATDASHHWAVEREVIAVGIQHPDTAMRWRKRNRGSSCPTGNVEACATGVVADNVRHGKD
jgi:hypothetical protein